MHGGVREVVHGDENISARATVSGSKNREGPNRKSKKYSSKAKQK